MAARPVSRQCRTPIPRPGSGSRRGEGGRNADRYRDRARGDAAAHRRHRRTAGIPEEALHPYGQYIAKIDLGFSRASPSGRDGKLILVTAITPTPAGEGKTTTTVGLGDALNRIGKRAMIALREPSLGPCFGVEGRRHRRRLCAGRADGGRSTCISPATSTPSPRAHNLLAAMIDNHVYWGNALGIDTRRITWRRVIDMNDRALRAIVSLARRRRATASRARTASTSPSPPR